MGGLVLLGIVGLCAYFAFGAAVILGLLRLLKYIWDSFEKED